jgi:hypothetical protein
LQIILETSGFIIAKGQLEIFPNVRHGDKLHQGIRFPCIEPESYVVNPNNLDRIGWRETFLELSEHRNSADKFLAHIPPPKPILRSERVAIETEVRVTAEDSDRIPVEKPIKKIEQAPKKKSKFNLDDRFEWTSDNRSNDVIGAHVSYVIEQEGVIDPTKAEKRVWQRLTEYGYHSNASNDEQADREHVRRWISCRLKKGDVSPLGKKPGSGDTRLNENRSRDAQHRFSLALDAALAEDTVFESKNALFKWMNSWLMKHKLATIGGGTWQKLQCLIPFHLYKKTQVVDQQKRSMKAQFEKDLPSISPIKEDHRELRISKLDTSQSQRDKFQKLTHQHPALDLVCDWESEEEARIAS